MTFGKPEYRELWARLRAKYTYRALPIPYLIIGEYKSPEGEVKTWIVGYSDSVKDADLVCAQLKKELQDVRRVIAPYYLKAKLASKDYDNLQDVNQEPEFWRLYLEAQDIVCQRIQTISKVLRDQGIPEGSIMQDRKFGVVKYRIQEVHRIKAYEENRKDIRPAKASVPTVNPAPKMLGLFQLVG